jgi:ABC-type glycerol-3-phosphate transport system substrate-binding protein
MLTASYKESPDAVVRSGVTRLSLWEDPNYRKLVPWSNYADVMLASIKYDTDPDWRPRVPQWPKIGEIMAVAIQAALVGQMGVKEALDDANQQIAKVMGV